MVGFDATTDAAHDVAGVVFRVDRETRSFCFLAVGWFNDLWNQNFYGRNPSPPFSPRKCKRILYIQIPPEVWYFRYFWGVQSYLLRRWP